MLARLLCSDVDGTLVDGAVWREGARDFLRRVAEAGAHVALCSARPSASLKHLADGLPVDALCGFGGAEILTREQGEWTLRAEHHLTPEQVEQAQAVAAAEGLQCWEFYADGTWVVHRESPEVDFEGAATLLTPTLADPGSGSNARHGDCRKVLIVAADAIDPAVAQRVEQQAPGVRAVRSMARYVEVGPGGIPGDKGLSVLAGILGVHRERVAAMGDHDNDREMLRVSGLPFALPPLALSDDHRHCAVTATDPYAAIWAALSAPAR